MEITMDIIEEIIIIIMEMLKERRNNNGNNSDLGFTSDLFLNFLEGLPMLGYSIRFPVPVQSVIYTIQLYSLVLFPSYIIFHSLISSLLYSIAMYDSWTSFYVFGTLINDNFFGPSLYVGEISGHMNKCIVPNINICFFELFHS